MPSLSNSINVETTANKKNGSPKPKPGCAGIWCSTEKLHNEVQVTLPNFPRNCSGTEICIWLGNAQSCPILTTHWFVHYCCICLPDFCLFSTNKNHTKQPRIALCLNRGCSQAVCPVGKKPRSLGVALLSVSLFIPCLNLPFPLAGIIAFVGKVLCWSTLLNKTFGMKKTVITKKKNVASRKLGGLMKDI